MKLTPEQRYTAYCILWQELNERETGFCLLWFYVFDEYRWFNDGNNLKYLPPELWRKRNREDRYGWFNCTENRFKAIRQCIEELEAKIKW